MSRLDVAVCVVTAVLAVTTVTGLVVKGRAAASWFFVVYLTTVAPTYGLFVLWPERFWTWEFWLLTDVVHTGLRAAVAFEIGWKTFRRLPVGKQRIRLMFAIVVVVTGTLVLVYPTAVPGAFGLTLVVARLSYGVAFLFGVFLLLTMFYGVPVDPVQRDIAVGFGLISLLMAFAAALSGLDPVMGWGRDFITKWTFPVVLAWWSRGAWGKEARTSLSRETMELLQPWRVKRVLWN